MWGTFVDFQEWKVQITEGLLKRGEDCIFNSLKRIEFVEFFARDGEIDFHQSPRLCRITSLKYEIPFIWHTRLCLCSYLNDCTTRQLTMKFPRNDKPTRRLWYWHLMTTTTHVPVSRIPPPALTISLISIRNYPLVATTTTTTTNYDQRNSLALTTLLLIITIGNYSD